MTTASQSPILIVEDHADTAEMLRRYLARHGLAAEVALDGTTALSHLSQRKPACVILDESMPDINGLDLLRRLQSDPEHREIPVVFYSAAYDPKKLNEAAALGAKGWFIKGISRLADLMHSVRAHAS